MYITLNTLIYTPFDSCESLAPRGFSARKWYISEHCDNTVSTPRTPRGK